MSKVITNDSNKQTLTFHNLDTSKLSAKGDFGSQSRKVQADIGALEESRNKLASLQKISGSLSPQQAQEAGQAMAQLKAQAAGFQSDQAQLLNLVGDGTEANQAVNASYQQGAQRINEALSAAASLQTKGLAEGLGPEGFNQVKSDAGSAVDSLNEAGKQSSFTNYAGQFNAGTVTNPFQKAEPNPSQSTSGSGGPSMTQSTNPPPSVQNEAGTSGAANVSSSHNSTAAEASGTPLRVGDQGPSAQDVDKAIGAKWAPTLTLTVSNHFADASGKITNTPSKENISSFIDTTFGGKNIPRAEKDQIIDNLTKLYSNHDQGRANTTGSNQAGGTAAKLDDYTGGPKEGANSRLLRVGDQGPSAQAIFNAAEPMGGRNLGASIITAFTDPVKSKLTQDPSPANFKKLLDVNSSTLGLSEQKKVEYSNTLSRFFNTVAL